MNDRLGLGARHGLADGRGVEPIHDHRRRAEPAQTVELVGMACRRRHLMAALDELPHEGRADRARAARNEDPHDASCR